MSSILGTATVTETRRAVGLQLSRAHNLLQSNSLRGRLANGTLWCGLASIASQVPSLAVSVLLGRTLGLVAFGQLAIIQTTVIMLASIGDLGLTMGTTRYVAAYRSDDPAQASRIIGFSLCSTLLSGLVLAAMLVWSAPWYVLHALRVPGLGVYLQCASVFLLLEMLNRVQVSVLVGLEAFRATAAVNALRGLFLLLAPVAAHFWGLGGALLALTCTSAATCAIAQIMVRHACSEHGLCVRLCFRIPNIRLVHLAGSLWLSGQIISLASWAVTVILVRQPAGVTEMALFTAADKFKTALLFLPAILAQATTPLIAHTAASGNRAACGRILFASSAVCGGVTGLLAVAMLPFAQFLMSAYGWTRGDAGKVLVVACLGCVPLALYSLGSAAGWTMGPPGNMLAVDTLRSLTLVSLVVAGFGHTAVRLAAANALSVAVAGVLLLALVRRMLRNAPVSRGV
jgi:O-antigen/teichoic acid export membrane protein